MVNPEGAIAKVNVIVLSEGPTLPMYFYRTWIFNTDLKIHCKAGAAGQQTFAVI